MNHDRDLLGDPLIDPLSDLPAATEALGPDRWPEQMAELADIAADELARTGLAAPEARRLGCRVAARLCQEFGGARYYWPRSDALTRAVRDMLIWADFDGTTHGANGVNALAKRHDMTEIYIRRILAVERARHRRRIEPELPLEGV